MRERDLAWAGCLNVRDLGGLPTTDGATTAFDAFIRGDNACYLTAEGRSALVAHGVRSVVDLRRPDEREEEPNPFAARVGGISFAEVPVTDRAVEEEIRALAAAADRYVAILERGVERLGAVFRELAAAPTAVYFHCFSGRDRTGIVSALLLRLARVDDDAIAADYALTDRRLHARYEEWRATMEDERRARFARVLAEGSAPIAAVLRHVDERYAGVEGFLDGAGVPARSIDALRKRLRPDLR